MLNAMLFGDRAGLNKTQRVGFERTGSFHLFVVSGMHVGLLAGLAFWLARRLKLREWLATFVTIALTFGYSLLTGFGAPVQRALFMTAVFLLARLLSRERNVLNALGAAALGVLVWSPGALFEASFQMTFLAIVAIGGIAVPLSERSFLPYAHAAHHLWDKWEDAALPPNVAQFRVMLRLVSESVAGVVGVWARDLPSLLVRWSLWALELALIGAVTEMVMVLPMALYFHRATMFAVPTNMLSVPLVAVGAHSCRHILCVPHQSMGGDGARRDNRFIAARSHRGHWPRQRSPCRRSASSCSCVVDRAVGDRSMGLLLLGCAQVAGVGVGCGGRIAAYCPDGVMARASHRFAGNDGGDRDRCWAGRFDLRRCSEWSDYACRRRRPRRRSD
jgi:ComEC/Rec2-related protein